MEAQVSRGPMKSLMTWLDAAGIGYEIHEHDRALTALATARAEGVDPHTFEKVVWVRSADGGDALVVVDANDHLDLSKAREVLRSGRVTLVPEEELEQLAPDCEAGAMPAVGSLFGIPTYADLHVCDAAEISFNAGTHTHAVRVDRAEWEKALGVVYADLAAATWREPAWYES
ncbi:MAG: YbaK/EbsC family protein [Candidatus Limnocylindrales bacterium]